MSMKTVTSLRRGLQVLRIINETGGCQIKTLQAMLDLPKPTIIRMVGTLVAAGYVWRSEAGVYKVSAKVLSLANRYDADEGLLMAAHPVLARLRSETAWPSDLAAFDGDAMVILDTGEDPGTFGLNRARGSRLPVLTTSLGRAYLAFREPQAQEELLSHLLHLEAPRSHAGLAISRLKRLLQETRAQGYSAADGEYLKNTRAVAVPILVKGRPLATINLMTVITAMEMQEVERKFVAPLKDAARQISETLSESAQ
ncbi:MAG: IclR family transcriptional regulator C-terminal domain-containing protein [Hyphomicrobiales bacterium]|nr:IclR family transcriptional regulator C-terminal domain-containing protein [Hyphomicrobiales bacterium]